MIYIRKGNRELETRASLPAQKKSNKETRFEMKLNKLEDILLKYQNSSFLVIEPGGNNGDRLTYMGMEKKLKELGINYTVLRYKERVRLPFLHKLYFTLWKKILGVTGFLTKLNSAMETSIRIVDRKLYELTITANKIRSSTNIILIHGGANVNDLWGHGIRLLKNVLKNNPNKIVIVAPQTYWFRETNFPSLFSKTAQEVYLFCRERYSYKLLNSIKFPKNIHVSLSQDTAFYLSRDDFNPRAGTYDLICLRKDQESVIFVKAECLRHLQRIIIEDMRLSQKTLLAVDISLLPNFGDFLSLIEDSMRVYTDRLHVAIMAAIIGKNTVLYSNSYFKSKGIFEFSLRTKYPNLKFVDVTKHPEMILK